MALGKGMGSLFDANSLGDNIVEVDINKITPNKNQPRKKFDEQALTELADSIKEVGILQPINARQDGEFYYIITGERRWRAARIAGLKTVPVYVRDMDELKTLEAALIENVQREDLNPIEEALTYKKFSDEFGLSQEDIAKKVGKSRSTVTNAIRLLNLDDRVINFVVEGKLSSGHARTLLPVENNDMQFELAEKIIDEGYSVRQTEEIVKNLLNEKPEVITEKPKISPDVARACFEMSKELKGILGTKVTIKNGKNKGKIEIEYYSPDDLDRIVGLIKGNM
ncbi:MAG: ParB/RepB/Spo0J family partition protein [Firmicutes bacterium]|nr:ParB/RepB/Spo0J family partition protein [Bacillota bacterium]